MAAKQNSDLKAKLVVDKLYINGSMHSVETINRLPPFLLPQNLATRFIGQYTFLWRKELFLSNFCTSKFRVNGIIYSCVEQFLKSEAATLFKYIKVYNAIMPSEVPAFTKRVVIENFDQVVWNKVCLDTMKTGAFHKFDQNSDLKKQHLSTAPSILAEASPYDSFWGISLSMIDPKCKDRVNWGQNHLGTIEMEVRQSLT